MRISGGEVAAPYRAMIRLQVDIGSIEVTDLELHGDLEQLRIGSFRGDYRRGYTSRRLRPR
jgi:hypothetical protein